MFAKEGGTPTYLLSCIFPLAPQIYIYIYFVLNSNG